MNRSILTGARHPACTTIFIFLLMPALASVARGKAGEAAGEPRAGAGQNASPGGTLFRQEEGGRKAWLAVAPERSVPAGVHLMALPGNHADIDTPADVRVTLWGSTPQIAGLPVMESVIHFNAKPTADVDLTLERGRIVLAKRAAGTAPRVRVAFENQEYEITLEDPDSMVAMEVYSRWPAGVPFSPRPDAQDAPDAFLAIHVLKGDASLKLGSDHHLMRPPPGLCYFHWDSETGMDPGPRRREHLPQWFEAARSPEAKSEQAAAQRLSRQLAARPLVPVLIQARSASDADTRRLAVYSLAAVDDLGEVVDALSDVRHADVRQAAVEALRNWIGRAPGKDRDLYKYLVDTRRYLAGQAETVLQLLHGLADEARHRADSYETLIAYLRSSRVPIRELASSYLYRWVPEARQELPFDAGGSESQRQAAYEAWSKWLTDGKLPPPPEKKK